MTKTTAVNLSNTRFADLGTHLLDLLHALEGKEVPLLLVGGFGLFLRQERVRLSETPTLYNVIPPIRATNDFDMVIRLVALADVPLMEEFRAVLDGLGYQVKPKAETYQFFKEIEGNPYIKVDLLARVPTPSDPASLHWDNLRVKPKKENNPLHGRTTREAIAVEDGPSVLAVEGRRTNGEFHQAEILLAHPYSLLLMKLFAFRDEEENKKKKRPGDKNLPYARKHVSDLYSIVATLDAEENDQLSDYRNRYENYPVTQEAGVIVQQYFNSAIAGGAIRLQEAQGNLPDLSDFLTLLREVFPVGPDAQ